MVHSRQDKDQKPGQETDPKEDNLIWAFIKAKPGGDDDCFVGEVKYEPKSHLQHKPTWLPCDGQKVKRQDYPDLEDVISASFPEGNSPWFHGEYILIPNYNGVDDAE